MREKIIFDIEISPNMFMVGFKKLDGKVLQITTKTKLDKTQCMNIRKVINQYTLIGFNNSRYDNPMLLKALDGATTTELFKMSERVVKDNMPTFMTMRDFDLEPIRAMDTIDLMPPQPAVFASLKSLGVRLNSPKLQELPYAYDKVLSDKEIEVIAKYNINDLDVTIDLYKAIKGEITLREQMGEQYGTDLRSKSGAQVATAVLLKMTKYQGAKPSIPKSVRYVAPKCVQFNSYVLQGLLKRVEEHVFAINPKNGQPVNPDWLKKFPLTINNTPYQVGVGGLHDKRKKTTFRADDDTLLLDIDVASYYPSMMIEFGYAPKHIKGFLDTYKRIYKTRLNAKRTGDKFVSNSLKLVLNSSFGLLGSMYSKFYSPDTMLQVTITGQLMLLMLIEEIEAEGVEVFYANTDGITLKLPKGKLDTIRNIVFDWELQTGMVMEENYFDSVHIRDVNSFVNITTDGEVKAKGVYAPPTLSKNNEYPIVFDAIKAHLKDGTPMEDVINSCTDVTKFVSGRAVAKGGHWKGKYLGKMVRFYYSTEGEPIYYINVHGNEAKVATTDGAKPMMDLVNTVPTDLDYDKYIELAYKHLENLC